MPAETQWVGGKGFSNAGSAAAAGAVAAPSGSSATTPPDAVTPPNEGLYGEYQSQALDAFNKAQIAIQQKRSGIYQNYGFNQDGSVDGNNMVGGYQQMKHAQALELDHAENMAHERHLGSHGLGAQVAEAPRFQQEVDAANFGNSYLGALDANSGELSGAEGTYQTALLDARRRQIEDDITNNRFDAPPTDPTDPAAPPTDPSARATAAAKRIVKTKMPTATTRVTARSTERAPAKKPAPKPTVYRGRH